MTLNYNSFLNIAFHKMNFKGTMSILQFSFVRPVITFKITLRTSIMQSRQRNTAKKIIWQFRGLMRLF